MSTATLELHYNDFTGTMPSDMCSLGGWNGKDIYISADCARPSPEFACKAISCCDGCYSDALRANTLLTAKDLELQLQYSEEEDP